MGKLYVTLFDGKSGGGPSLGVGVYTSLAGAKTAAEHHAREHGYSCYWYDAPEVRPEITERWPGCIAAAQVHFILEVELQE